MIKRFLKPEICQDKLSLEMAFDPSSFLQIRESFHGFSTKSILEKLLNRGDINEREEKNVCESSREFYKESLKYVPTKMNVNESFWQ